MVRSASPSLATAIRKVAPKWKKRGYRASDCLSGRRSEIPPSRRNTSPDLPLTTWNRRRYPARRVRKRLSSPPAGTNTAKESRASGTTPRAKRGSRVGENSPQAEAAKAEEDTIDTSI